MSDLTLCSGVGCPRRKSCKRNSVMRAIQQVCEKTGRMEFFSHFASVPWDGDYCEYYVRKAGKK